MYGSAAEAKARADAAKAAGGHADPRAGHGAFGGSSGFGSGGKKTSGTPASLLDSKYPGAKKKKDRQYEASWENAKTLIGKISDLTNPAVAGLKMGVEAVTGVDMPTFDDSFSGRMDDVPSRGAGYADSGKKDDRTTVTGLVASKKKKTSKPTNPLGSVGTILSGVGGSLVSGGL